MQTRGWVEKPERDSTLPKNTQHIRTSLYLKRCGLPAAACHHGREIQTRGPHLLGEMAPRKGDRPEAQDREEELTQKNKELRGPQRQLRAPARMRPGKAQREAVAQPRLTLAGPPRTPRYPDGGKVRAAGRVQGPSCRYRALHLAAAGKRPPCRACASSFPRRRSGAGSSDPSCHSSLLLFPLPVWHGIICAESC